MRAQEFVKPHQMAKLEKTGRIVEILRHQDQVDFSDEPGWYLINLEPGKRVAPDMKWIPDSTRFEWVREFKRADAVVEDITPNTIHKLADRTGVKWDNEPNFLQLTKRLTGKEHLDDLNQTELHKVKQHLEKQGVAEGSINEASSDEAWELVGQPVPEIQQFVKQMGYGNDEQSIAKITSIIDRVPATQIPAASIPKLKNLANKGNDAQTLKSILQISGRPDAEQQYTKLMQARDAAEGRNRDVSGYIQYVKSGNYDPPVLLKLPTGVYVIGGRTRLYAALALGVPANVKIINANNFKQGVAENFADGKRQNLDFDKIYGKYLKVTDNNGNPDNPGFSIVTPLNGASWHWHERPEFKQLVKQKLNDPEFLGDHKYQQIIDAMAGNKFDPARHLYKENFADGKGPGRPGDSARHGIPKGATMAELERASHSKGRKGQLARWQLNMRRGHKK